LLIPNRVKLIVHYHAEILTSKLIYTCYRPLEKLLFERANTIIATSPKLRDEAEPLYKFKDKCLILANAIDTNHLELTEADRVKVINLKKRYNNKKIILTFGRHVPYKGLKYLLEAESNISNDAVIIIGGSGPLTQELKSLTSSDRVHFVGRIPDDELKVYLHAADVFAFPSVTKAEAFGLALAESMYCYTPPVTFTIPASGVNYVSLHGETGLEVENSNAIAFANAINKLLDDDNLRCMMGKNSHNRVVANFSIETYNKNINEIYKVL
jgi:glycosyltransferase involved in cell wall biosynthesis